MDKKITCLFRLHVCCGQYPKFLDWPRFCDIDLEHIVEAVLKYNTGMGSASTNW